MAVTAEIATYVASLGNNETWQKLPDGDEVDYTIIKKREEQVINLAGTVQSEKGGGTTGHIGMVMTLAQFALILNSVPFIASVHPRLCDYDNLTLCTTNQQRTESYQEHGELLEIFETKQMVDTKIRIHVMSCFNKDDYIELRKYPI